MDMIAYTLLFLVFWFAFFPIWRLMARRRLKARARQLWLADLPGGAWLVLACAMAATGTNQNYDPSWLERQPSVAAAYGLTMLALIGAATISYIWICIECLMPDRRIDPVDVFD
jgi:uncharacterized membrane protein YhaH (DUF805 family)